MKRIIFIGCILFTTLQLLAATDPVDYVDPFICTQGDHGHWHPSALAPHGLVKLGPDTYPGSLTGHGDLAHSGYDYSDQHVRGFSHFHKGSSGGTQVCDRAGLLSIIPFSAKRKSSFYQNPIIAMNKKSELAQPGFYSVQLADENINVELTATAHVGLHRYTFSKGGPAAIFLYEGNRSRSRYISLRLVQCDRIEGIQKTAWGMFHFIMLFSEPIRTTRIWTGTELCSGDSLWQQGGAGLVCEFGSLPKNQLLIRVAVSLTSLAAARLNLQAESPDWDMQKIRQRARTLWNNTLGNILVDGEKEYKKIFYTALYHTCFLPVTLTDTNADYPGLDAKTHQAKGYIHYGDYAFWDSFRSKYPLYSLWAPNMYRNIVQSLHDLYEQAENWAPFPECNHPAHGATFRISGKNGYQAFSTCRHEHMLMVMVDAYFKNIFDPDIRSIYPHLAKEALLQMPEKYDAIGFIPARPDQTVEYCWDNWCVAQIAQDIGRPQDYEYFMKRSNYWKNTWDPDLQFFRARATDGTWMDFPDDPAENREKYTYEGSKWQIRWNALHDMPAMIKSLGGRKAFVEKLEYFFQNDLYTAGNQIDLHAPFLFNYAGAAWRTQKWVHKILAESIVQKYGTHTFFPQPIVGRIYKDTPDGYLLEMDDDYGCMAAWYVLAAMGLYQVCPGQPYYQLCSPLFSRVELKLNDKNYSGHAFIIEATGLSATNHYIQSARYYDDTGAFVRPWNQSWIAHKELVRGGKLVLQMGPLPNPTWGNESPLAPEID